MCQSHSNISLKKGLGFSPVNTHGQPHVARTTLQAIWKSNSRCTANTRGPQDLLWSLLCAQNKAHKIFNQCSGDLSLVLQVYPITQAAETVRLVHTLSWNNQSCPRTVTCCKTLKKRNNAVLTGKSLARCPQMGLDACHRKAVQVSTFFAWRSVSTVKWPLLQTYC